MTQWPAHDPDAVGLYLGISWPAAGCPGVSSPGNLPGEVPEHIGNLCPADLAVQKHSFPCLQ